MRIYFAGSIRAGREMSGAYDRLIRFLSGFGEVLTEHVGNERLLEEEERYTDRYIHDRDMRWLLEADVVVAEVTVPSLGVGYEIARGLEHGKPVVCLYRPSDEKRLSAMISGCPDLHLVEYGDVEDAERALADILMRIKRNREKRGMEQDPAEGDEPSQREEGEP
ncbi:MAG: nucleoside 2-deoxyribosyltransferase [Thermoplasmata archaeon]|nr:nucleoside 2-deoxyribosyltransferase [Thermoplasmata archaeon]